MLHPGTRYGDGQAKTILRTKWRYRPTGWVGHWVRARPSTGSATMPHLIRSGQPGSLKAITAPDGMYIRLAAGALTADVLSLEICGSLQNLHDKRSRFLASTSSLLLLLPLRWLKESQRVQRAVHERWHTFRGVLAVEPVDDLRVPVARMRVFLLVPDSDIRAVSEKVALEAHEYLLPHSALDTQYQTDLKAMLAHAFHSRVWA